MTGVSSLEILVKVAMVRACTVLPLDNVYAAALWVLCCAVTLLEGFYALGFGTGCWAW